MEIEIPPKKDMEKVYSYEERQQLRIFKGQCFNNASTIKGVLLYLNSTNNEIKSQVFDLAQELYDEGLKRGWLKLE